jgi:hypothetical protein
MLCDLPPVVHPGNLRWAREMLVVRRVKQEGIHAPICGVDAVGVVIIYEELHSQLIAPFAFRVVFF